jgi:signal transduction histidine kinase
VVEGDEGTARTLAAVLRHCGYGTTIALSAHEAAGRLRADAAGTYDLALVALGTGEGAVSLAQLRALQPHLRLIVLTPLATFDSALQALRDGAYDYLVKPLDLDELCITIARALEHGKLERELASRVRELEAAHAEQERLTARLQQRVDEATVELREKVEALDAANAQLSKAQEENDLFIKMVAHEMGNLMHPISLAADLIKRPGIAHTAVEQYTETIEAQVQRLDRLVEDLMLGTHWSNKHFSLRRKPADVAAAVSKLIEEFRTTVRDRRFSLERPAEPIIAEVDLDRVVQAVRNLIDNAVKYSAEDGAIEVELRQDAEKMHVRVRDYGAGIPEEKMHEIFEAGLRLDPQSGIEGMGLGLYIARGIVRAHGGELSVSNGTGPERILGAIFTLELPLHAPGPPPETDGAVAPAAPSA